MSARRAAALAWAAFLSLAAVAGVAMAGWRKAYAFVWPEVSPEKLLRFAAPTPFQYRVLIPGLARLLWGAPAETSTVVTQREALARFLHVDAAATVAFVVVAQRWFASLLDEPDSALSRDDRRLAAMLLAGASLWLVPFSYLLVGAGPDVHRYPYFPWDLPALALFTLALHLLRSERWALYYPVFVLATLNRETTCFLPVVYLLARGDSRPPRALALHAAAQTALWVAIKLCLRAAFSRGAGLHESHLDDNVFYLSRPEGWAHVLSALGFLWAPAAMLGRRVSDPFVRRGLWVMPLWLAGMLSVGNVYELRVYGELTPLALAAWALILRDALRGRSPT